MNKLRVLLMYGGESSEHDVSLSSARNVYAAMDGEKYDIDLCYIDRHGKWWLLRQWEDDLTQHGGAQLVVAPGMGSLISIPGNTVVHTDVILPILHGRNGEDGTVQGLAKLLHVPIVGCDITASAVCMDKILTKQILSANNILTAEYVVYRKGNPMPNVEEVASKLGLPMFVKPSRSGSSVGVTKVHSADEFEPAIIAALVHDERVLIERAISGRELETGVLGNPPNHRVSGVGEVIPSSEFYDYSDKYAADSKSRVIAHAELDSEVESRIRELSSRAYEALGCRGLARVDYLLDGDTPYILEVNTLPGFTNISMYPKLWQHEGMSYATLIDKLISLALE